jgi:hypothetical protein
MSAITREIVFKDMDENHGAIVKGNSIELIINYKSSGTIDIQDAELLINLLREAINEIVGAAQ